jgi:DNA replication protein DnaC
MRIDYRIPQKEDRIRINDIIFDELVYGKFYAESRSCFNQVINNLRENGCDAVVIITSLASDDFQSLQSFSILTKEPAFFNNNW